MKTNLTPFTPNKLGQVFRIARHLPVTVPLESPLHTFAMYCYGASFYKIPFKKKKDIIKNGENFKGCFSSGFTFTSEGYYKKLEPSLFEDFKAKRDGAFPPFEAHSVLAYAFNQWVGAPYYNPVVSFQGGCSLYDLINNLYDKKPTLLCKAFISPDGVENEKRIKQLSLLIGVIYKEEAIENFKLHTSEGQEGLMKVVPEYFIFDDLQGKDTIISYDDFIKDYSPINNPNKSAHIFSNPPPSLSLTKH